eukprot:m.530460 g.530460  ORF g.530460 m.530460 type:complete len:159 (-) comp57568_c0_seq43:29-505(-)
MLPTIWAGCSCIRSCSGPLQGRRLDNDSYEHHYDDHSTILTCHSAEWILGHDDFQHVTVAVFNLSNSDHPVRLLNHHINHIEINNDHLENCPEHSKNFNQYCSVNHHRDNHNKTIVIRSPFLDTSSPLESLPSHFRSTKLRVPTHLFPIAPTILDAIH